MLLGGIHVTLGGYFNTKVVRDQDGPATVELDDRSVYVVGEMIVGGPEPVSGGTKQT